MEIEMRKKHVEIAKFDLPSAKVTVGLRSVVVTPKKGHDWTTVFLTNGFDLDMDSGIAKFRGLRCHIPDQDVDENTAIFPVIPSHSRMLASFIEASVLRRIPDDGEKPSAWLKKRRSWSSYDAMLIDLLVNKCGDLAQDLAAYRDNDAPDPLDHFEMRVNHADAASPALEINLFGFWVTLFKTCTLKMKRTKIKVRPTWALETAPVKFSQLQPGHRMKALDALKRYA